MIFLSKDKRVRTRTWTARTAGDSWEKRRGIIVRYLQRRRRRERNNINWRRNHICFWGWSYCPSLHSFPDSCFLLYTLHFSCPFSWRKERERERRERRGKEEALRSCKSDQKDLSLFLPKKTWANQCKRRKEWKGQKKKESPFNICQETGQRTWQEQNEKRELLFRMVFNGDSR